MLVVTVQNYLAGRGLSAAAASATVSVASYRSPSCSLPGCGGCLVSGE
ncbi:hypothetical protein [Streptomyces sp. NBC_01483]|nr:hypothetical protein [Streptomyces sp. NBC_01483]